MTYEEMRERLEELERKIEEQGATEAVLLSIDDGVDTRRLLMKRKTLYDMIYPMVEESVENDGHEQWLRYQTAEEKALLCSVAWAQARHDIPDSVNRLLRACYEAAPAHYPLVRVENGTQGQIVSNAEDAMAVHHLSAYLNDWKQQMQAKEDEWER